MTNICYVEKRIDYMEQQSQAAFGFCYVKNNALLKTVGCSWRIT